MTAVFLGEWSSIEDLQRLENGRFCDGASEVVNDAVRAYLTATA